jgi:hypothetical protein
MAYRFGYTAAGSQKSPTGEWPLLEDGDYNFSVTSVTFPVPNDKGYYKIHIELSIQGTKLFDWRFAGISEKTGEPFDMITPFLIAINRIPKGGEEDSSRFWNSLAGAHGRLRLTSETWGEKTRNRVAFYFAPKQLKTDEPPSYSPQEVARAQAVTERRAGKPHDPELDAAPDDLPF